MVKMKKAFASWHCMRCDTRMAFITGYGNQITSVCSFTFEIMQHHSSSVSEPICAISGPAVSKAAGLTVGNAQRDHLGRRPWLPHRSVQDIRQAVGTKAGSFGDGYTVRINARQSYLFYGRSTNLTGNVLGRWFVGRK